MIARFGWIATLIITIALGASAASQRTDVVAAEEAVQSWLGVVDAGRYAESWQIAAAQFKASITQERWEAAVGAARLPLGGLQSRQMKSTTTAKANTLPGAPDGEYVVFQFETSFGQKQAAQETVTAVRETDGAWRIVGYFVR